MYLCIPTYLSRVTRCPPGSASMIEIPLKLVEKPIGLAPPFLPLLRHRQPHPSPCGPGRKIRPEGTLSRRLHRVFIRSADLQRHPDSLPGEIHPHNKRPQPLHGCRTGIRQVTLQNPAVAFGRGYALISRSLAAFALGSGIGRGLADHLLYRAFFYVKFKFFHINFVFY